MQNMWWHIWPKVKHYTRIWLFKPNLGKNLLNSSSEIITTTTYSYHCVTCILSKSESSSKVGAFKTKAPPKKKKEYLTLFSPLFNNSRHVINMLSLLGSQKNIPQSKNFEGEMFELFIAFSDITSPHIGSMILNRITVKLLTHGFKVAIFSLLRYLPLSGH